MSKLFLTWLLLQVSSAEFQKCGSSNLDCPASQWKKNIVTFPDSWYSDPEFAAAFGLPPTDSQISAVEYISNYMPCCKHCAWSLGYPKAMPIVFSVSPSQDTCESATAAAGSLSLCYMDCTAWPSDFSLLDKDGDALLQPAEFLNYVVNPAFAPPQLYYLYTGGRQAYSSGKSKLDPEILKYSVDLNKDSSISLHEWFVFRHFIGPLLVTRSGPSVSSPNQPLSSGALGGFFVDTDLHSVWHAKVVLMLLEYYVTHSGQGYKSLNLREPKTSEQISVFQQADIDGSGRISFEEHYFRIFADQDADGFVNKQEYYTSLYRTSCSSICPSKSCSCPACKPSLGTVPAGCTSTADDESKGSNFKLHDLDDDGNVSFIERKFMVADTDVNSLLSWDEWTAADYPLDYGPWRGSLNCTGVDGLAPGECNGINRIAYRYYMAYHYCSLQGLRRYTQFSSPYPLWTSCTVVVKVRHLEPMVQVNTTGSEAAVTQLTAAGWLCFPPDDVDPGATRCYDGLAIQTLRTVADRLGWTLRPVLDSGPAPLLTSLGPPTLAGPPGARKLQLGLMAGVPAYRDAERAGFDAAKLSCSSSFHSQDGLVVVKRSALANVMIEASVLLMVISPAFVNFVAFCFFAVLIAGHIFWFIERFNNPQFDSKYLLGVLDGSWFAMVTVTTVGYGDKVPSTLGGKGVTVIWMFFGILAFGVFCSNISAQLNLASAENSIQIPFKAGGRQTGREAGQGAGDLKAMQVGVPAYLTDTASLPLHFSLGKELNFEETTCSSLADCAQRLQDHSIVAFIAPYTDVMAHFTSSGLSAAACGNPLTIVGDPFAVSSLGGPSLQVCGFSDTVYVSQYLTQAVSDTLLAMQADGAAAALSATYLGPAVGAPSAAQLADPACAPDSLYRTPQLIAFGVVLGFYILVNIVARSVRKLLADRRVIQHLQAAVLNPDATPEEEPAPEEAKPDGGEAKKRAGDPVAGLVARIERVHRLQLAHMKSLNDQVREGQQTIARVSVLCGWVLVPIMGVVAGLAIALLFVWAYSSRFVFL